MTSKDQPVDELFSNNFGEWLEKNGCTFVGISDDEKITYKIDLNKLKPAIMELCQAECNRARISELEKMKSDAKKYGTWTENTAMGIETEADERIAELQQIMKEDSNG